jgi:shikimate dehydrogenase
LGVALHDAGYAKLQLDYKYVAFGAEDISTAVEGFKKLGFRGFGVSMPHKQTVINLLDELSADVKAIGACNTVVNEGGTLIGYNTDWRGAMDALKEAEINNPRSAVIIGSGGVARAIAYALKESGAKVQISSRDRVSGEKLVEHFDLDGWLPLNEQGAAAAELVVNATPASSKSDCPVLLEAHSAATGLLDVVFAPLETDLVRSAREAGKRVAPGWRMLLHQALHQFRLYTGEEPPIQPMADVLEKAFSG